MPPFTHALVAALSLVLGAGTVQAQIQAQAQRDTLPFTVGERLTYTVRVERTGSSGKAVMAVSGPVDVRGVGTELLSFDVAARLGFVRVTARSKSWLDPRRMSALRFWKHESRPLAHSDQSVDIDGANRSWTKSDGTAGTTLSDVPLDELSFIYFLRTLRLAPGETMQLNRHFDQARNPTDIRVLGVDTVAVGGTRIPGTVVEMRVRDAERFGGSGAIRLTLTDDQCRVPLRMESSMPVVGKVVLTLTLYDSVTTPCAGVLRGRDTAASVP